VGSAGWKKRGRTDSREVAKAQVEDDDDSDDDEPVGVLASS
jgi:hypothetical protein